MEAFYGEKLDAYLARPSHHPEGILNKNEQALEFILDELMGGGDRACLDAVQSCVRKPSRARRLGLLQLLIALRKTGFEWTYI